MSKLLKNIFPAPIWSIIWTLEQDHYRSVFTNYVLPYIGVWQACWHCRNFSDDEDDDEGLDEEGKLEFVTFECKECGNPKCLRHEQGKEGYCASCTSICDLCHEKCVARRGRFCMDCAIQHCEDCKDNREGFCSPCCKDMCRKCEDEVDWCEWCLWRRAPSRD